MRFANKLLSFSTRDFVYLRDYSHAQIISFILGRIICRCSKGPTKVPISTYQKPNPLYILASTSSQIY